MSLKGSQLYVYKRALAKLRGIKAKHRIVSAHCLLPEEEKYKDWAKNSDEVEEDLDESLSGFEMILKELEEEK